MLLPSLSAVPLCRRPGATKGGRAVPGGQSGIIWLVAILLSFGLRLYHLDSQSFWFDEGWSSYLGSADWARWGSLLSVDNHPPLYYLLLKGWVFIVGNTDFALRFPSLCFSLLTLPLTYLLGKRLFGQPRIGLLAALFLGIAPFQVYHAQEARMYALVACLTALSTYLTIRLLQEEKGWLGYVISAALALYTSYFAGLILLFQNLAVVRVALARQRWATLVRWLVCQGLITFSFLPWLGFLANTASRHYFWRDILPPQAILNDLWRAFSLGKTLHPGEWLIPQTAFLSLLVSGLLLGWRADREGWLLVIAYLGIPVGTILLLSRFWPLYIARNLIGVTPAYALLLALGTWSLWAPCSAIRQSLKKKREPRPFLLATLCGLILALSAVGTAWGTARSLAHYYTDPRYARDDFRAVAKHISQEGKPGEAIILLGSAYPFLHYYDGPLPYAIMPEGFDQVPGEEYVVDKLNDLIRTVPIRVWLVEYQWEIADPQELLEGQLRRHGIEAGQAWWQQNEKAPPIRIVAYDVAAAGFSPLAMTPLDIAFGRGERQLALVGYRVSGAAETGGRVFLRLWWRPLQSLDREYTAFAHLLDGTGKVIAQHDKVPLSDYYPITIWRAGEILQDSYILAIPEEASAGPYSLEVGLYWHLSGERLEAFAGEERVGDHVILSLDGSH